jgi:NitT/TauT family transport system permease protein
MRKLQIPGAVLAPTVFIVILAVWEFAVIILEIPPFILPSPSLVVQRFFALSDTLLRHSQFTFLEAALGFGVGATSGTLLGFVMVLVPAIRSAIYPLVIATQTTPKIAIAPLIILWFGVGLFPKVLIVALLAFFPVLINVVAGLESTDRAQLDLMRSVDASQWQIYRHVRFPAAVPFIFAGLKLGLTISIIGAVIAEWVASQRGLGYLLLFYNAQLRTANIFAVLIALLLMASLSFGLIILAERLFSWDAKMRKATEAQTLSPTRAAEAGI